MPRTGPLSFKKRSRAEENESSSKRVRTDSVTRNSSVVRRNLRPYTELKRITDFTSGSMPATYQYLVPFPHPQEGNGPNTRDGARITCRRIGIKGSLFKSNAVSMQTWRVIVFLWKQNLTAPTPSSIVEVDGSQGYISSYNIRTQSSFTVIYDKTFTQIAQTLNIAGTGYADSVVNFEYAKNVKIPMTFSSGGSSIPPSDNQVYMLLFTDTATMPNINIRTENTFFDV